MITFKNDDPLNVEIMIGSESNIEELLEAFKCFLLASGFSYEDVKEIKYGE